jgi:hypothetical protein
VIQFLFFAFVGSAAFIALSDWRKGLFLLIVVGLLQDPIRKLMPGAPGYMVLVFVPIWLAICMAVLFSGRQFWSRFLAEQVGVANGVRFLGFSLAVAFMVLIVNYGSRALPVGVIGLLGYLFPVLAIAVGYYFTRHASDLISLMKFYSLATAVILTGGLMEYWDFYSDWPALGTGALGTTWYRQYPGHIVFMISGFFRSPDLMGWHAATMVMFSIILSIRAKTPLEKMLWLALAVWGSINLLISGRNKMIFMPAIFMAVAASLNLYIGAVSKVMRFAMAGMVSLGLLLAFNSLLGLDSEFLLYTKRGSGEATERFTMGGFQSAWTTYQQSGFFGEGLGSASTGARYGGVKIKTWQESGPSKIMVELGVIGFLSIIALGVSLIRVFWKTISRIPAYAKEFQLYAGFIGITVANAASFIVSHQAFGDPFLVTFAGLQIGITLSAHRWVLGLSAPATAR